ncbi:MAG: CbrC family protein [Oscillospiraceae bacterium]
MLISWAKEGENPNPIETGAFINGWQQEYWIAHCDDYCAFVGYVGWKELVEMGINNEIEKNYNQELNGFELKDVKECMYNEGSMQGYLFKCLHCGEHFLYVDCD